MRAGDDRRGHGGARWGCLMSRRRPTRRQRKGGVKREPLRPPVPPPAPPPEEQPAPDVAAAPPRPGTGWRPRSLVVAAALFGLGATLGVDFVPLPRRNR